MNGVLHCHSWATMHAQQSFVMWLCACNILTGHGSWQAALGILEQTLSKAPLALAAAKAAVNDGYEVPLEKGLAFERAHYTGLFGTEDRLEALRAFAEKRLPRFEGR